MQQAASLTDFASKPLIVITAGRGHDAEWMLAQAKLAALSTNSRHRVVADATHQSLLLDETHAAAASHAIRDVVTAVRTFSIRCAPLGDQRICWLAPIRRWSSHCTAPSVVAVEIGSSLRRAVA